MYFLKRSAQASMSGSMYSWRILCKMAFTKRKKSTASLRVSREKLTASNFKFLFQPQDMQEHCCAAISVAANPDT